MRFHYLFWVICSVFLLVDCAPKPSPGDEGAVPRDGKDGEEVRIGDDDDEDGGQTTLSPSSDLSVDLPENWDQQQQQEQQQPKEDPASLFLNKNDKNDLEPYPMALSEDGGEAYDGQASSLSANEDKSNQQPRGATMERVLMRAEYYGEPPSMGREPSSARRKRADRTSSAFRSVNTLGTGNSRLAKRGLKYLKASDVRTKRDTHHRGRQSMSSEDILALLALWDAQRQQQRAKKNSNRYAAPQQQPSYYEDAYERLVPVDEGQQQYYDTDYYGNYRRKRPWQGFGTGRYRDQQQQKRKRTAEADQYYYYAPAARSYEPDLYALSELLGGAGGSSGAYAARERRMPLERRMIL